ncbi:MAG: hypothetical protein DLM50_03765 [Candidatus Meridianibacter frigidus]|nr:MAG: hypothetical protein DLM50_03765 [Candidatus Eremiobacteraeota bacterium]
MKFIHAFSISLFATLAATALQASAQSEEGGGGGTMPYSALQKTAQSQEGLFRVWDRGGNVALELRPDQFNKDYVETAVPINGLGGYFVLAGQTDFQEARIMRFLRNGDTKVTILWPHTRFLADKGTPLENAVRASTADSVLAVAKIISKDPLTGNIVFDVSPFLTDVMGLTDVLNQSIADPTDFQSHYRLDPYRTFFGKAKAFPKNVLIEADQTFTSEKPAVIDTVPDPRSVQIKVHYNIAELPADSGYMPRLFDDRVGFWDNAHIDFSRDYRRDDHVHYIIRWNMQPSDPSARISPAKNPIVYYLSDTIPTQYKAPIREALLTWNKAFERIGISGALEVRDQPNDPNWDPDDIRYNVVRWLTESNGGGFAEAQVLYNPYTGQLFRSAIVIDSDLMRAGKLEYGDLTAGERSAIYQRGHFTGADYLAGAREQYQFGMLALQLFNGLDADHVPVGYANDFLKSIVLHESGHDFGLMHNFISSEAYTGRQLQSKAFTRRNGIYTSVMEYGPLNLWPKGTPNGDYFQTVLGPYDYHAIQWGYARIPGARTPDDERSTLNQWASQWTNPRFSLASDEDVAWQGGHAIDPRVQQWDLTNDNIGWCETQMNMVHGLIRTLDSRFPSMGQSYEEERSAFGRLVGHYNTCARVVSHYMGGEYLSRAHRGDAHGRPGLSYVPLATQRRAFAAINQYVFSPQAWSFSPSLMNKLVYSEAESDWGYFPPPTHAVSGSAVAAALQNGIIAQFFSPIMLARLDDMPSKYGHNTMNMSDLFVWMQSSVYGDLAHPPSSISLIHRNLQRNYAAFLSRLSNAPPKGTPPDAQALARHELTNIARDASSGLRTRNMDLLTRAHVEALLADVRRALDTRSVLTVSLNR